MRKVMVRAAEGCAWCLLLPLFAWSRLVRSEFSGFTAPSQLLAYIPGLTGILLRRVWYRNTLKACGTHLTVDWLGVIRCRDSELGHHCTIGVANWVGWVRMGNDVMTGSHVVLLSGGRQHTFADTSVPMRVQRGAKRQLVIGDDVWLGTQVAVLADVSSGTVVGAGSVVTRTYPPYAVIAGNPARLLRMRDESPPVVHPTAPQTLSASVSH